MKSNVTLRGAGLSSMEYGLPFSLEIKNMAGGDYESKKTRLLQFEVAL